MCIDECVRLLMRRQGLCVCVKKQCLSSRYGCCVCVRSITFTIPTGDGAWRTTLTDRYENMMNSGQCTNTHRYIRAASLDSQLPLLIIRLLHTQPLPSTCVVWSGLLRMPKLPPESAKDTYILVSSQAPYQINGSLPLCPVLL